MLKRFAPILILGAASWLVFFINNALWHGQLTQYGIVPRHLGALPGILWAPFLHASWAHLLANTLPLLVLGGLLCARQPGEFIGVTILGIILTGGLTWLFARNACHIGASGLVFCYFGFLASRAWFERTLATFGISILCLILYGGLITGVLPRSGPTSWENHAAGLVSGIGIAWAVAKVKNRAAVGDNGVASK